MLSADETALLLRTVARFVDREVVPAASALEHRNEYPTVLVDRMKEIGLFGMNVPEEYGGGELTAAAYATIFEELARGWMSVAGVLGTHLVICDIIKHHATSDQKRRFLPALASAAKRGALALTEAHAGSDLAAIRTTATRAGDVYCTERLENVDHERPDRQHFRRARQDRFARDPTEEWIECLRRREGARAPRDARHRQARI